MLGVIRVAVGRFQRLSCWQASAFTNRFQVAKQLGTLLHSALMLSYDKHSSLSAGDARTRVPS